MPIVFTRDQIKAVQDLATEYVAVPEWGEGGVYVRTLSAEERDTFDEQITVKKKQGKKETREVLLAGVRAKLVALTAVDEQGARLFEAGDWEWLLKKSGAAVQRISDVAMRLAGLSDAEVEKLGEGSAPGQSGDSPSA